MDGQRPDRERARENPLRATILDLLKGEELTMPEIRSRLPDDPPLSAVNYHLAVLQRARLVGCIGGVYRTVVG